MTEAARPAFYALARGGWRDYVTLLHLPYTLWHLGYVAIGAALAPDPTWKRLLWTLAAFALAMGIGAHALDELNGRPLATAIPSAVLVALSIASVAAAAGIGVAAALAWTPWLLPCVAFGAFVVVAYNLELFGGRFHSDRWFAAAWGAFPAFTAYWANALSLRAPGLLVAAACFALSVAQRRLSTPVRELRRRTLSVTGEQQLSDGRTVELSAQRLAAPLDGALAGLSSALPLLAAAAVLARM